MILSKKVFVITGRASVEHYCRIALSDQVGLQFYCSHSKLENQLSDLTEEFVSALVVDLACFKLEEELRYWLLTLRESLQKKLCFVADCYCTDTCLEFLQKNFVPVIEFPCKVTDFKKKVIYKSIKKVQKQIKTNLITLSPINAFIGKSSMILELKSKASLLSQSDCNILIQGETGTGKTFLAELIHKASYRKNAKKVYVNMANLDEQTCEAELFGCVNGAFTGAVNKKGLVEEASGGTLILDEIAETPIVVQAKLLDFIQTHRFRKKGCTKEMCVDVRIIFATNKDLLTLVRTGEFRKDLYYRITENRLYIPSLRERKEDILELSEFFIKKSVYSGLKFDPGVEELLGLQDWEGNVRQLKNELLSAAMVCTALGKTVIEAEDFS